MQERMKKAQHAAETAEQRQESKKWRKRDWARHSTYTVYICDCLLYTYKNVYPCYNELKCEHIYLCGRSLDHTYFNNVLVKYIPGLTHLSFVHCKLDSLICWE